MSIFSHLTEPICYFSLWTGTRYPKLNPSFVIKWMILLFLSMTVAKIIRGQDISRTAKKDFYSSTPSLIMDHPLAGSLFNDPGVKETHLLNVLFESERKENNTRIKDQNIRILQRQAKIEHANLKQATLKQSITTACAAFLIMVVGLVYVHYCRKQKDNSIVIEQNKELKRLIEEKEWLVKEIHHRVKNNLQTVICLLESQAMYLENDALKAVESGKHRIFSMSLIHQKLYQSADVKTIDMSVYLPEFVSYLRDSFDAGRYIHFSLEVEPLQLSASQAIPLALVLNEAITNSIKYAFPGNKLGEISIKMRKIGKNIELIIRDNGIGMIKAMKQPNIDSLGLKLMRGLVEEINGQIQFNNNTGTIITITFKIYPLVENYSLLD